MFDKDATNLACYPWELLHDGYPTNSPHGNRCSAFHCFKPAEELEVPHHQHPCHSLYVSARPNSLAQVELDQKAVKASIAATDSLEQFEFEELKEHTHQALKARLINTELPPISIHFDGHGRFPRYCPDCGTWNKPHQLTCDNAGCSKSLKESPAKGYLAFEKMGEEVDWIDTATMLRGYA